MIEFLYVLGFFVFFFACFKMFDMLDDRHKHNWSKWSDPIEGKMAYISGKSMPVLLQIRKCDECGEIEVKKIK